MVGQPHSDGATPIQTLHIYRGRMMATAKRAAKKKVAKKRPARKPAAKKKVGRPRVQLDEAKIRTLARIGCTMGEIAAVMECSISTLERHFDGVIKEGKEHLKGSLRRWQYTSAKNGNVTMQIWLGKQLLGQKDRKAEDLLVSSPPDEPLRVRQEYDFKNLSSQEAGQLGGLLQKAFGDDED